MPGRVCPTGRKGTGQIGVTSFSVPAGSLEFWDGRLRDRGVRVERAERRWGAEAILFSDPSGLRFELVATDRDARPPWTGGGIGAEVAIRGLHGVTMVLARTEPTVELMTGLLGFTVVGEMEGRMRLAVDGDEPGKFVEIIHDGSAGPAKNGLGTVHHVAMAIGGSREQWALREELVRTGCKVTEVLDRQYFQSIYFREPGGVLFEVATAGPGFAIDESPAGLGGALKLPPWEEVNRGAIEESLPPLAIQGTDATLPGRSGAGRRRG